VAPRTAAVLEGTKGRAELAERLRAWIGWQGSSAAEVSRRLGHHPAYLSRAFAGEIPLRMVEVFGIFAALGERPGGFFATHYPLGGGEAGAWARRGEPTLAALVGLVEASEPAMSPAEWTARLGRLLRRSIGLAGLTQKEVSRRLGSGPGALGQALRKANGLTAWQVWGTLAAIGLAPARFLAELFAPQGDEVAPGLRPAQFWEAIQRLLAQAPQVEGAEGARAG